METEGGVCFGVSTTLVLLLVVLVFFDVFCEDAEAIPVVVCVVVWLFVCVLDGVDVAVLAEEVFVVLVEVLGEVVDELGEVV